MNALPFTQRFERAVDFVLKWETEFVGGHDGDFSKEEYVRTEHDPNDPGGTTRYGIDQRSQPHVDIWNLTLAGARQIYWDTYWHLRSLENGQWVQIPMDDLPEGWGECLFDVHVNGGPGVMMAQRACVMAGAKIPIDGGLGPVTIAAMHWAGKDGLENFLHLRQSRYDSIAHDHPSEAEYLPGWTNRNNALAALVGVDLRAVAVAAQG